MTPKQSRRKLERERARLFVSKLNSSALAQAIRRAQCTFRVRKGASGQETGAENGHDFSYTAIFKS